MNKKLIYILTIAMVLTLAIAPSVMGARQAKEIVDRKLVESEYGKLGHWLGIGDRIYIITYKDGTSQEVLERTTFPLFRMLSKAVIVEGGYETRWATAGTPVAVNFRAVGVNLPSTCPNYPSCTGSTHKFETIDITGDYQYDVIVTTGEIALKVACPVVYSAGTVCAASYEGWVTMTIPALAAGKRSFEIQEYVKSADGSRWIRGAEAYTSNTKFDVVWTQEVQAGQPTPKTTPAPTVAVTPINPYYTPPLPMVELAIESEPSGATVQVGGGIAGNTPVLISLSPQEGEKTLILSKSGYKTTYTKVSAATPSPYIIKLEALAGTTPTPGVTPTLTPGKTPGATVKATPTPTPTGEKEVEKPFLSETLIYGIFGMGILATVIYFVLIQGRKPKGKKGKR